MTEQQWVILCLKIVLISGFISIATWIGVYTWLAPWWKTAIGQTLVIKSALLALILLPSTLSLFLNFSRLTSEVAGWLDVILIGAITPVMIWRSVVWWKMHKNGELHDG